MAGTASTDFSSPDEVRTPDKCNFSVVKLGSNSVAKAVFQPGWRWSECIKPVVGGDACQNEHLGFAAAGRMHVLHDDGTSIDIGPGDAYHILPGHDAWVVGDDECVYYEFQTESAATYAKSS